MTEDSEFYIGYLEKAPPGLAGRTRGAVILIGVVVAAMAILLTVGQGRFQPGVYEFGTVRTLHGVIDDASHPSLWVERPGRPGGKEPYSRYWLVSPGKRGPHAEVADLRGRPVRLRGSLVYRDGQTMVEIAPGSVESDEGLVSMPSKVGGEELGVHTLTGEILDSKCFLGVMRPANLKPHRACAARCISGGIPPLFRVHDARGRTAYLLLVSEDGRSVNKQVLDYVAEPIEITGRVERYGERLVLRADPATFRRL